MKQWILKIILMCFIGFAIVGVCEFNNKLEKKNNIVFKDNEGTTWKYKKVLRGQVSVDGCFQEVITIYTNDKKFDIGNYNNYVLRKIISLKPAYPGVSGQFYIAKRERKQIKPTPEPDRNAFYINSVQGHFTQTEYNNLVKLLGKKYVQTMKQEEIQELYENEIMMESFSYKIDSKKQSKEKQMKKKSFFIRIKCNA